MLIPPDRAALLASLTGLIPDAVGHTLAELASAVPAGQCIVEIGSYQGKSTCYLAEGARTGVTVMAVDPWDSPGNVTGRFEFAHPRTFIAFLRQVGIAGHHDRVVPHRGFSTVVAASWRADRPIGLLYVDGSHLERDVVDDLRAWSRHLAPGAVIACDDYDTPRNPGVKIAVDRFAAETGRTIEHGPRPLVILR